MNILIINGQNHKGSTYHIAHDLASKIDGEIKELGTDIDKIMPPVSRFGGGNRSQKKQTILQKLKSFFEKYFGIGGTIKFSKDDKDE